MKLLYLDKHENVDELDLTFTILFTQKKKVN